MGEGLHNAFLDHFLHVFLVLQDGIGEKLQAMQIRPNEVKE
jgi:hypothetical protein